MEPGTEPTDEQLALLQTDADLREVCEDIMILQGVLAEEKTQQPHPLTPPCMEGSNNSSFLQRLSTPLHTGRGKGVGLMGWLAIAALFAGAIFLLWPAKTVTDEELLAKLPTTGNTITLMNSEGETIPLDDAVSQHLNTNGADVVYELPAEPIKNQSPFHFGKSVSETSVVTIPYGHSLQITLSDGTRVYMHPGSRLVYPDHFIGSERTVTLSGEAYFCVAHHPSQPFVVHTPDGIVSDYGTEFNVCTEDNKTEVVLVEGCVGVTPNGGSERIIQPSQKATINSQLSTLNLETADTDPYTAWRDGYFYFNEQTIDDIITQLACSYNLTIECHNTDLLKLRLRYIIPRNSTPAYAIEILNRLQRGHISLEGNRIVVK